MRNLCISLIFMALCFNISALTLEDIIRLSQAQVAEDIIISIVQSSDDRLELTVDDIILLKNHGVSEKVILAIVAKNENYAPQNRELTPFDQFFLSMYYSHQYGWPEPNYDSPRAILEQGLYYSPPDFYPYARQRRIYGWGYTYNAKNQTWSFSPYSMIVPTEKHIYYRSKDFVSPSDEPREERLSPTSEVKPDNAEEPLLGDWYHALEGTLTTLESQTRRSSKHKTKLTSYLVQIQSYIHDIRQYRDAVRTIQETVPDRQKFSAWTCKKLKATTCPEEKDTLCALEMTISKGEVNLAVDEEVMELMLYSVDWERDLKQGTLREPLLQNIVARLEIIHCKFSEFLSRADRVLEEYSKK